VQALAGIASAGLVAAGLVLAAPANARDVINGTHDTVHCGPGDDDVFVAPGNTVADDCEDIIVGGTPR
jgi:hypothetical protein